MRWPLVRRSRLDAMTYDRDVEREGTRLLTGDLATVRTTLRTVRGERDYAHVLLRMIREDYPHNFPPRLMRAVNCAVALESEGDIADAREAVVRLRRQVQS